MPDLVTLEATPMVEGLLGWFAETTLVALILAAMAALVAKSRWLAAGPAARHTLWLIVMIRLVTPPLIQWPWSISSPILATHHESHRLDREATRVDTKSQLTNSFNDLAQPQDDVPIGEPPIRDEMEVQPPSVVRAVAHAPSAISPWQSLGAWVAIAWLCGSVTIGFRQGRRVFRFRRLLIEAKPAPGWLVEEAAEIGGRLRVLVPPILVVPGLSTPVLWCLGRPVLLVPTKLLKTLEAGRWRSIVAHELAHLRRGDPWVRRLELVAGLIWWWNPVYWLARSQLDFEAELACDAWAVWASPSDRFTYVESLIQICTTLSPASPPTPALGIAGTGRSFERRLTMILRDQVDRRVSAPGLLAASLLAALALPSWTLAKPPQAEDGPNTSTSRKLDLNLPVEVVETVSVNVVDVATTDDDDDDADDDAKKEKASKGKAKSAKSKADQDKLQKKMSDLEKEMEGKFGPGSEFAAKMEAMGKEIEAKFGPGSDFATKMEAMGKEMEAKFGPGSEFAKKMEALGSDLTKKVSESMKDEDSADVKPDSRQAKRKAEMDRDQANKAKAEANKAKAEATRTKVRAEARAKAEGRAKAAPDRKARRIEMLESRIEEMMAELKKLKAESDSGDEEDEN